MLPRIKSTMSEMEQALAARDDLGALQDLAFQPGGFGQDDARRLSCCQRSGRGSANGGQQQIRRRPCAPPRRRPARSRSLASRTQKTAGPRGGRQYAVSAPAPPRASWRRAGRDAGKAVLEIEIGVMRRSRDAHNTVSQKFAKGWP